MTRNKENEFDPRSHIGETHGIYIIIDMLNEKDKYGHYIYVVECKECGYKKQCHYGQICSQSRKVTICKHIALDGKYMKRTKWDNHRIKSIFNGMRQRCYSKKDDNYIQYGAKGITICDEWLDNPKLFEEWSLQNGYRDNLTIDRISSELGYSPDNCRWVTLEDNAKYKSTTSLIDIDGEIYTGRDWAQILGLGINIINKYIRKYGLENTKEFIKRFKHNPNKHPKHKQSYYDLYMNR